MTKPAAIGRQNPIASYGHWALICVLGVGLVVVAVFLTQAIWTIWPAVEELANRGAIEDYVDDPMPLQGLDFFFRETDLTVSAGQAYLLLIALFGALGSFVHTATSFTTYVGNKKFKLSWTWWYLLRLFIGAAVALLLLTVVLGGLMTVNSNGTGVDTEQFNPYMIGALSGLAGWFSKVAADKLEEIFEVILDNAKDTIRTDKLAEVTPQISAVTVTQNDDGSFTMDISGDHLSDTTVISVGDQELTPTHATSTSIQVPLAKLPETGTKVHATNLTELDSTSIVINLTDTERDAETDGGADAPSQPEPESAG